MKDKNPKEIAGGIVSVLEEIQEKKGHLEKGDLVRVSEEYKVPLSEVYGVATFYTHFRLGKSAKHLVQVCAGTSCHSQGGLNVLEALKKELKISEGCVTKDKKFELEVVRCFGECALAPVIRIDGKDHVKVKLKSIPKILAEYK
ncbi:NAD(P)H-dependent oxidoreductase subunit E [Candidatus Micrarchaeota archaeon]|nr:NAD(P)H-dependent oxidoreductase subunit E [Candidatus Micrarchaeota archaeon]